MASIGDGIIAAAIAKKMIEDGNAFCQSDTGKRLLNTLRDKLIVAGALDLADNIEQVPALFTALMAIVAEETKPIDERVNG